MHIAINRIGLCEKVVTELAVLNITENGFELIERAPGVSVEEILAKTVGRLIVKSEVPEMVL